MQHLCRLPEGSFAFQLSTTYMSNPGKVLRVNRIKPHAPLLVRAPSIRLSFNLAAVVPRRDAYRVCCGTESFDPTPSIHRLGLGLPGSLILFAPLAFVSQRQVCPREPPSPLVFLPISAHFTATPGIPLPPDTL